MTAAAEAITVIIVKRLLSMRFYSTMLNFISRRLVRFILPLKILVLLGSIFGLGYMVIKTEPGLEKVIIFCLTLFVFLGTVFSFWTATNKAIVGAMTMAFLLFLKMTGLLTFLNVALFIIFLVLLALYLWKK